MINSQEEKEEQKEAEKKEDDSEAVNVELGEQMIAAKKDSMDDFIDSMDDEAVQAFINGSFKQKISDFNEKLKNLSFNINSIANRIVMLNLNEYQMKNIIRGVPNDLVYTYTEEDISTTKKLIELMYLWLYQHFKIRHEIESTIKSETDPEIISNTKRDKLGLLVSFPIEKPTSNSIDLYPVILNTLVEGRNTDQFNEAGYRLDRQKMIELCSLSGLPKMNINSAKENTKMFSYYNTLFKNDTPEDLDFKSFDKNLQTFNTKEFNNSSITIANTEFKYLGGSNLILLDKLKNNIFNDDIEYKNIINELNKKYNTFLLKYFNNDNQLKYINKFYNLNVKSIGELKKYGLTIDDLKIFGYNLLKKTINDKYSNTIYNDNLHEIISQLFYKHFNYKTWLFLYQKYFKIETFNYKINNGLLNLNEIISFYKKHKVLLKKSIIEPIYEYLFKVKKMKNYKLYNNISKVNITKLLKKYTKKTYSSEYYKIFLKHQNIRKSLLDLENIKNKNHLQLTKINKHYIELYNIVIDIILVYRDLYLYILSLYLFYSLDYFNKHEYTLIKKDYQKFLNIDEFLKKNKITKKQLNDILHNIKSDPNLNDIHIWSIIDFKLNYHSTLKKNAYKLLIAIHNNETMENKTTYYSNKLKKLKEKLFILLEKLHINFGDITKNNSILLHTKTSYITQNFKALIHFKNKLNYLL